ncbi:hypothetical protein BC938DRAFT_474182 [Jimgerdemannia flammicorona]|uniref:Methyltransferase domain-containing protein n=1 Tax=Jimgerdemannia flammicorona TaxID=994334 RepID=A0A433Q2N9_9FUNG|nr:hypothetical protein BC938DRAFT_474182 [Jimgerdemannia flammicorona]
MTRTVNFNHANETPPPSVLLPSDHLKWIDGRGFDVNGNPAYIFPNDTAEQARLDLQHHLIVFTLGGHYVAPVGNRLEQGIKVLETGCGTGVWAMDMARKYPRSQFTGTDIISPEIVATFGRELEARGLVDVVQDHKTMLVGWGQNEIALAAAENLLAVFKSMKPQTTMALGLGDTEYDTMVDKAMAEISENMGLWKIQFTYGTKPAMRSHA